MKPTSHVVWLVFILSCPASSQWVQTGPESADIMCFGKKDSILFVGTLGGHVFTSLNSGSSWIPATNGLLGGAVHSIVPMQSTIFVATKDGVFRSEDNGETWTQANNGLSSTRIWSLIAKGSDIFAGTDGGGIFRSSNGGVNWIHSSNGFSPVFVPTLASNKSALFAGTYGSGVFRSTDNGSSWSQLELGVSDLRISGIVANDSTIFVAADRGAGVFRSTDNGESWTRTNVGLINGYVWSILDSPAGVFVGTGGSGVFRSTNNGDSWTQVNQGLTILLIRALTYVDSRVLVGTLDGVFHFVDGTSRWERSCNGLSSVNITALTVHKSNLFAGSFGAGVFRSSDSAKTWTRTITDLDMEVRAIAMTDSSVIVGTEFGVYLSTNGGATWTRPKSGLQITTSFRALAARDSKVFAISYNGEPFFSMDYGMNWARIKSNITLPRPNTLALFDSTLVAGTIKGVLVSTNSGATWEETSLSIGEVLCLTRCDSFLFAGTNGHGVLRSTDFGRNWTKVNNGLLSPIVFGLSSSHSMVFAGTWREGIFCSLDKGTTWFPINGDLADKRVSALTVIDSFLIAGTNGSGVWYRPLPHFLSSVTFDPDITPATFYLQQNFPNPFNPSTVISFTIGSESFVTLSIFDLLGREKDNLLAEHLPPGTFSREWNAASFPSGVYLCRLQAGSQTQTRKLLLLR